MYFTVVQLLLCFSVLQVTDTEDILSIQQNWTDIKNNTIIGKNTIISIVSLNCRFESIADKNGLIPTNTSVFLSQHLCQF